ncbi:DUF2252 family protein [Hansschlegelia quercus]|uniref:DUF2252 domain-containing protein n=1 Tax=Hansschlegelia quercus TaxID=2528245 RepID=A0A4Q9GC72_9HYPH|nr:DUF2252 family protein [Hansschlegelia quercus]TBN47013.1 DUF2252 domain-containing protein [Hansschlegelia quercus]
MPSTAERSRLLEQARRFKMARSAHAYVRGNTLKFYEWLAASPLAAEVPEGPSVWICGDCHLGNLGPLADGKGGLEIQIRDLDQTVIGNPALDIIRLGLSLASATRGSDLPGVVTAQMMEQVVEGYEAALLDPAAEIEEAGPEPDVVRTVRRRALGRRWHHLARERLEGADPRIPIGKKFWELGEDERQKLAEALANPVIARTVLSLPTNEFKARLVDAAYWMKGCSSLGLLRYAAIIGVRRKGKRERFALIDIKEAAEPAAPSTDRASMPTDDAERVVAGARALSPHLGERMAATTLDGRSIFIRELHPQDLKLEVEQFSRSEALRSARYLAWVVGRAHARQMASEDRKAWRGALAAQRKSDLDAPLWLWRSVVELSGSHEVAYLQHCRDYAMAEA